MVKNASDTQSFKFIPLTKENYLKDLLDQADEAFKNYLGFNKSIEVLSKKLLIPDERHKYWLIQIDGECAGILYIYDYKEEYKKCSLGYGLLPKFRGKSYSTNITNSFCDFLHKEYDIIRIQVDIEVANLRCLGFFTSHSDELGFKYEGTADNYWGCGKSVKIFSKCYTD